MGSPVRIIIASDVIRMTGINTMSRMKAKIRCIGDECISKNNNLSIKFEVLYDFLELILGVIKV
jgi:hypothetical protein